MLSGEWYLIKPCHLLILTGLANITACASYKHSSQRNTVMHTVIPTKTTKIILMLQNI